MIDRKDLLNLSAYHSGVRIQRWGCPWGTFGESGDKRTGVGSEVGEWGGEPAIQDQDRKENEGEAGGGDGEVGVRSYRPLTTDPRCLAKIIFHLTQQPDLPRPSSATSNQTAG